MRHRAAAKIVARAAAKRLLPSMYWAVSMATSLEFMIYA
jgi:hypothetical protein